jgi:predicted  nucleic acid-binding Zn-ribbon protein
LKDLEKKYTNVMRDLHKVDVENKELKNKAVQYKKEIAELKKRGAALRGVVRPASDTTFCTR